MTGEIIILGPLLAYLFLIILVLLVYEMFKPSKSRLYRRMLTDMYVVGKIKNFAGKEDVSIKHELSEFAKFTKNTSLNYQALDETIERDLQAKVAKCLIPEGEAEGKDIKEIKA